MEHEERVELITKFLAKRALGEIETAVDVLTEDVVIDASRRILDPVTFEGHDGFRSFVAFLDQIWSWQSITPLEFIAAGDDDVIVPVQLVSVGRESNVEVKARAAWVVTFRGEKISRLRVYQSREEALEAAGLQD
jgi:ketosteroid isomerase-like protein